MAKSYKFGGVAVNLGMLTVDQLKHALKTQMYMKKEHGNKNKLGDVCKILGLLHPRQVDRIMAELKKAGG